MARDKISVELELITKQAQREINKINRQVKDIGKTMGRSFGGGGGGGGDKVRALGTGLSKATVKADEFSKSMEASNARVIAFGASAGLIMGVDRALKAMVSSAIKVEKALLDVNVVLNATSQNLDKFGKGMFKVAKQTAQSFDTVSEAATELARQGLGMEKTLARTKDALILTRLTGMNAADAVKSLTAAVNSFNKEGVTSAQIINRMAKVDAAFAVSSEDLAKSISRVGASAVSAGVSMNELMAITTSVQQRTARGGAVIGNAFKTIFTRLQRKDVLQNLRNLGVAVTDFNGNALSGIQVLQNLAKEFDGLGKATQSSTAEQVAGVFQVNILKAALSDLSSANSDYARALRTASSATDEAYQRNEQLNQSLDALINRTLANLTSAGAGLGGALEPALKNILGTVNNVIESFGKGGVMEGFGKTIGSGLLKGLGDFIGGPGLVLITAVFGKVALSLGRFANQALQDVLGINQATKQRAALEEAVVAHIASEPALLAKVRTGTLNVLSVERDILNTVRLANAERARIQVYAPTITGRLMGQGMKAGPRGATIPGGAGGFIPNFASAGGERAAAAAGGYRAGAIRTMSQPGAGTMMYNSAETVKRFPGMSQSAIMPPQGSPAGAGYKAAFGAAHGFDPYAGRGFVPNFAAATTGLRNLQYPSTPAMFPKAGSAGNVGWVSQRTGARFGSQQQLSTKATAGALKRGGNLQVMGGGIAMLVPRGEMTRPMSKPIKGDAPYQNFQASFPIQSYSPAFLKRKKPRGPIDVKTKMEKAAAEVTRVFAASINPPARDPKNAEVVAALETTKGSKGAMSAAAGAAFEVGMNLALDRKAAAKETKFGDFDVRPPYARRARDVFGGSFSIADYKISSEYASRRSMTTKIAKELLTNGPGRRFIKHTPLKPKGLGFVPNFSPLSSAVAREMQAGVPASAIRIGSSPSLRSAGNPGGMGVYNTIHEPAGLQQGISRSRSRGVDPRGHGVPNFFGTSTGASMSPSSTVPSSSIAGQWKGTYHGGPGAGASIAAERAAAAAEKGMTDAGKAATDSAKASAEATKQTRRMGAAMGGMMIQMAAGAAAANMDPGMAQTGVRGVGSMAGYAGMGYMMGGPWGAAAGAAVGGVGMGIEILQKHTDEAKNSFENLSAELAKIQENSNQVAQSLEIVGKKIAELGQEDDPGKRVGLVGDIINNLLDNIANVDDPAIQKKLRAQFTAMKKGGIDATSLAKMQEAVFRQSASAGEKVEQRRMGTNVRGVGGMMDPNAAGTEGARGGFGVDFMSNRASKRDWGGLAQGIGNPLAWFTRSIASSLQGITGTPSSEAGFLTGGGQDWDAANALGRQLNARKYAPGYADDLMGYKIDGKSIQQRVMGNELQRFRLEGLQQAFEADSDWDSKAAWEAFEKEIKTDIVDKEGNVLRTETKEGAMSEILRSAGVSGDLMKIIRESLNTKEARNIVLRQMFGMKMDKVNTAWFDFAGDLPAIPEREGAGFSRSFRTLADQDYRVEPPPPRAPRAPAGVEAFTALIKSTREASASVTELGLSTARQVVHEKKLRSIQSRYDISLAGTGMGDSRTAAAKTMDVAFTEAEEGLKAGTTAAVNKFTSKLADSFEGMAGDFKTWAAKQKFFQGGWYEGGDIDLMGGAKTISAKGGTGPGGQFSNAEMGMKMFLAMTTGNIDRQALQKDYDAAVRMRESQQSLGLKEQMVLEYAPKVLKTLNEGVEQYNRDIAKEVDLRNKAIEAAKTQNKVTLKTIELAGRYARGMELQNQRLALSRATERLDFIDDDLRSGRITGTQYAGFKGAQRKASRDYLGLTEENMKSNIFRDEFTMGPRQALEEFENAQRSVAQNMKSSFSEAFQSISSGADSVKGALANMAQSILNSISQVSSNMFTNMMFSKMGFAQGGLVPGYAGGGVVTGGSGYKDDVPTMMQGGEFVIKKSSAQKIGYGTLNAINGYAQGGPTQGPSMWKMGAIGAGASALSGIIGSSMQPGAPKPLPSRDYGFGKGKYGHFGGADPDAGQTDAISGGAGRAGVSLGKGFVYYRRDPETGRLISERARPTEGRFEVSQRLSLLGRLGEDPQTSRMFNKEQTMSKYQNYLETETQSRKDQINAVKRQKRSRLIGAYMNAAMLIGGAKWMQGQQQAADLAKQTGGIGSTNPSDWGYASGFDLSTMAQPPAAMTRSDYIKQWSTPGPALGGYMRHYANGGSASGTPAMVMGGEYIMSPETVRTYGTNFMSELNRGNVPGYQGGGPVGGTSLGNQGGPHSETLIGGNTTNNVKISVNIDKNGKTDASASAGTGAGAAGEGEGDREEVENNKALGELLQGVVLEEIVRQQRPGGLLRGSPHSP